MLPSVSLLISNYNGSPYLHTSLEGICNQTHPADEIIIVEDGSTDRSLDIIKQYAKNHQNIKILINETNKGLLFSINRALKEARSDYIVWAASDDYLAPHFLEKSLNLLQKHPNAGICFSQFAVFIDGTSKTRIYSKEGMGSAFDLGESPHFLTPQQLHERLKKSYLWMSGNTVLARREALLEMGGFLDPLRWHADWFSFYILAMRYGVCMTPEILTFMRELPASYSRAGMNNKQQQKKLLGALVSHIHAPSFRDVFYFFRDCPALLTPFGAVIFSVLLRKGAFLLFWKYLFFYLTCKKRNLWGRLASKLPPPVLSWLSKRNSPSRK